MVQPNFFGQHHLKNNIMLQKKTKIVFLISLIGFVVLFTYFNKDKNSVSDYFKSGTESFVDEFSNIEMNREKYLGEVADTTNHMNAYMSFGETCLPMLDQWNGKIHVGDYVSKKKNNLTLLIERNNKTFYLYFDNKDFSGAPPPCKCKKLGKN